MKTWIKKIKHPAEYQGPMLYPLKSFPALQDLTDYPLKFFCFKDGYQYFCLLKLHKYISSTTVRLMRYKPTENFCKICSDCCKLR